METDRPQGLTEDAPAHMRWWLLAIVSLGAGLRLFALGARSVWIDEAVMLSISDLVRGGIGLFNTDITVDPPLFPFLVHCWYTAVCALPGVESGTAACDFLLRLLPCLVGVLTIPLVFVTARVLVRDEATALLAALLYAIAPFQVYYAQELRNYALHVTLCTAALLFFVRAVEGNRARDWCAWTVLITLGIYNNFVTVWVVVAFNVCFVALMPWYFRRIGAWIVCNLAVIAASIPALKIAFFVSSVLEGGSETWYPYPNLRIALITIKDFFMGYSPNSYVYMAMILLALGLIACGAVALRGRPRALVVLAVMAFAPILLQVLYWQTQRFPYYTHRLMIFSAVPVYMLAAQGLRAIQPRVLAAAALAVFAALTAPALADHYANRIHPSWDHRIAVLHKVDNRDAAQFIADRFEPGDAVVHRVRYSIGAFRYYLERLPHEEAVVALSQESIDSAVAAYPYVPLWRNFGMYPERIETFTADKPRVWYVKTFWEPYAFDPERELIEYWLDGHMFRETRGTFDGVSVLLYRNDPELKAMTETLQGVDFGVWRTLYYHSLGSERGTTVFPDDGYVGVPWMDEGWGLWIDGDRFPLETDNVFKCPIVLHNRSDAERTVECRAYESAAVIEPLEFSKENVESDVWRPTFQYDAGPPEGIFNLPGMTARLDANTPDGDALYKDLPLDTGNYDVWVRIVEAADPVGQRRALVRFSAGTEGAFTPIGATDGSNPGGNSRWGWHHVGQYAAPGGLVRFRASAHNVHRLDTAYFDLDRVMFVPRTGTEPTSPEIEQFTMEARPGRNTEGNVESRLDGQPSKRIDIEAFDPASKTFRRIAFRVHGR
ncbi:MAG: hypothetical protein QG656_598 [Candidatus Hydrogenedentes bacterium]|nr:hypothetical protein [Candidatus Hydrogenedentota bacterium]